MKFTITVSGLAGSGKDTFADYVCKAYSFNKDHLAKDLKDIASNYFGWDGLKDDRGRKLLQLLGTEVGRSRHQFLWLYKFMTKHGMKLPDLNILANDPITSLMPRERAEAEEAVNGLFKGKDRAAAIIALRGFLWDGKMDKRGATLIENIKNLASSYYPDFETLPAVNMSFADSLKDSTESDIKFLVVPDVRFKNEMEAFKSNGAVSVLITRPGTVQMQHASEKDLDGAKFDFVIENNGSLELLYCRTDEVLIDILSLPRAS